MKPGFVDIPKPPSVNAAFRNASKTDRARNPRAKGRFKSQAYLSWIAQASSTLAKSRPAAPIGFYRLELQLGRRAGSDLDNFVKCLGDTLKAFGWIVDDKLCERLEVEWADDLPANRARFRVSPVARRVAHAR